ncbi:hypothetical protein BGZ47_002477 [Haplosporangium gracile]|nr:hypothetical protein BGZ47_002477 [Haplosporangium gracile]
MLEKFYQQIASLLQLEVSVFTTYSPKSSSGITALPQLMTLSDGTPDHRAYLSCLRGSKDLKKICGMASIEFEKIAETMAKKEIKWMVKSWPKLERIEQTEEAQTCHGPWNWTIEFVVEAKT